MSDRQTQLSEDELDKALVHIRRCDELFDGNTIKQDREFAYNELRVLTFELIEKLRA